MAARVNEEMCVGCGACAAVCPANAITLLAAESGPNGQKKRRIRPDGMTRRHVHGRRPHESGLIARLWEKGHVCRGR